MSAVISKVVSVQRPLITFGTQTSGLYREVVSVQRLKSIAKGLLGPNQVFRQFHCCKILYFSCVQAVLILLQLCNFAAGLLRVVKLVTAMVLLTHWNGCIQYLVPVLQGIPEDSWIAINNLQVRKLIIVCSYIICIRHLAQTLN